MPRWPPPEATPYAPRQHGDKWDRKAPRRAPGAAQPSPPIIHIWIMRSPLLTNEIQRSSSPISINIIHPIYSLRLYTLSAPLALWAWGVR